MTVPRRRGGEVLRFHLIDKVEACEPGQSVRGLKLTSLSEDYWEVGDDGPGIPEPQRGRVFDRFVRLDDSRARSAGGSGLGLAIVREVVTAHSGTVTVLDSPTGGALLRIRLPLDQSERDARR